MGEEKPQSVRLCGCEASAASDIRMRVNAVRRLTARLARLGAEDSLENAKDPFYAEALQSIIEYIIVIELCNITQRLCSWDALAPHLALS